MVVLSLNLNQLIGFEHQAVRFLLEVLLCVCDFGVF